ncbi:hypothetical protein Q1695_007203 [Nippostrongylus brasiliensis]|nr:hypothetical protein Q1695_007203 [Nippostrongylus brasiliensis]
MPDEEAQIDGMTDEGEKSQISGVIAFEDVYSKYPQRPRIPILRGLNVSICYMFLAAPQFSQVFYTFNRVTFLYNFPFCVVFGFTTSIFLLILLYRCSQAWLEFYCSPDPESDFWSLKNATFPFGIAFWPHTFVEVSFGT